MSWKEVLIFGGVFVGWFLMVRWVLPYFGVPTCMSGSCSTPPRQAEYGTSLPMEPSSCPFCTGPSTKTMDESIPPERSLEDRSEEQN